MAIITLGQGNQTHLYSRGGHAVPGQAPAGGPVVLHGSNEDNTITDFGSIYFSATLAGTNEVPPNASTATGTGTFALNKAQNSFSLDVTTTGLDFGGQTVTADDNVGGFHFHRAPPGVNGAVKWGVIGPSSDLDGDTVINAAAGTVTSVWDGSEGNGVGTTLASELPFLLANGLYLNIHTTAFPGGEIRGQVIKQDTGADLIDLTEAHIGEFATVQTLLLERAGGNANAIAVLETFFESVSYKLTLAGVPISLLDAGDFVFTSTNVNDVIDGSADIDDLFGAAGNDTMNGLASNDRLFGESGNDNLNGGIGNDRLYGGLGNDGYTIDSGADVVIELAGQGTDTVNSSVNHTLAANVENLNLLTGAATTGNGNTLNNTINGNANNNTLNGGAGNDILNGLGGADTQIGGAGNDVFHFDVVGDSASELAGGGTDLVRTLVSINALGANLENVQLNGVGNFLVVGNTLANTMNGNSGINQLRGLDGNDLLFGFDGVDTLLGGAGKDQMAGGNGDDDFHFDALADMGNTTATRDVITDFAVGFDDLDFNTMDANSVVAGNQNFAWRGTAAFSAAGQLRYIQSGGNTIVQGNLDNNLATIEFEVQLNGLKALTAADIIV